MRISNGILFEVKETDIKNGCFTVPDGVRSIGDFAFWNRKDLNSITIPEGVETIGNFAFAGCVNLERVVLPSSVVGLGASAFKDCIHLQNVMFANDSQLSLLGDDVFFNCYCLFDIELPETLEKIAPVTFRGCPARITHSPKKKLSLDERISEASSKKGCSLEDMSDEKLHEALYTKLSKELVDYYNELLKPPTPQALSQAYEYVVKSDIVAWVNNNEIEREQTIALLKTDEPLNKIFSHYEARETDYMEVLGRSIEMVANERIERDSARLKREQTK